MSWRLRLIQIAAGLAVLASVGVPAKAAEPRPWLCRDKPVFTAATPVRYEVTHRGVHHWVLTLMKFQPGSGHDGFTVISTQRLNGPASGHLSRGSYYAIAMYRDGGHWICPAYAHEADEPKPGVVADLCYDEHRGNCAVRLSVFPNAPNAAR